MQAELVPGQMLEGTPYRILRLIGEGGMGAVYEVEHVRLTKRYVAKTLHARLRSRDDLVERMEIEAKSTAKLRHPNIVDVHDLGVTTDGKPYFIMDKLEGIDLRRLLRAKKRLDVETALRIILDVLEALAAAHRAGLIHRDIKPENIFLAQNGLEPVVKLLDFGIARVATRSSRLTGNRFVGTLQYAAPEQLEGQPVSARTDIYAVGCVLFEMIAGRGPFHEMRDPKSIGAAHRKIPAPSLAQFAEVPEALARLVASALEKDPARRPMSALAFAQQLYLVKQHLQDQPLATANTTNEMLMTAVSEMAPESNGGRPMVSPFTATEPSPGIREEDKTIEAPLFFTPKGGTLENAGPPAMTSGPVAPTREERRRVTPLARRATNTAELVPLPHVPTISLPGEYGGYAADDAADALLGQLRSRDIRPPSPPTEDAEVASVARGREETPTPPGHDMGSRAHGRMRAPSWQTIMAAMTTLVAVGLGIRMLTQAAPATTHAMPGAPTPTTSPQFAAPTPVAATTSPVMESTSAAPMTSTTSSSPVGSTGTPPRVITPPPPRPRRAPTAASAAAVVTSTTAPSVAPPLDDVPRNLDLVPTPPQRPAASPGLADELKRSLTP